MSDVEDTASVDTQAPAEVVDQPQVSTSTEETSEPGVASSVEQEPKGQSLKEKMEGLKNPVADKDGGKAQKSDPTPKQDQQDASSEEPKPGVHYEANYKYKAFGKEKELDPLFRSLIKDAESEKKVKEVFTRADAFDDMKQRYEAVSTEGQKTLQQYSALDRDVRRVTNFLNKGDYDNFFQALKISDDQLLQHLQRKASIAQLSPDQQFAYNQGVQARAENVYNQEQYEQMNQQYSQTRAEMRRMQLDQSLMKPEVDRVASSFDGKMGQGQFRQLVIDEAVKHFQTTNQDLPAEDAVMLVLNKFGKLFDNPPPQATVQAHNQVQPAQVQTPQAPGVVNVQGKPVIPNVQGRGTSPVKQAPKSLEDLRKMGQAIRMQESQPYESNI